MSHFPLQIIPQLILLPMNALLALGDTTRVLW